MSAPARDHGIVRLANCSQGDDPTLAIMHRYSWRTHFICLRHPVEGGEYVVKEDEVPVGHKYEPRPGNLAPPEEVNFEGECDDVFVEAKACAYDESVPGFES